MALASCSADADDVPRPAATDTRGSLLETVEAQAQPGSAEDCLLLIWSEQNEPDIAFDRAHDAARGGAISCATGTSPSQFRGAIMALREAAASGEKTRLLKEIGIPMLYIDSRGERRELSQAQIIADG